MIIFIFLCMVRPIALRPLLELLKRNINMKVYFYQKKNIKKIKCKNLEYYTGKVGDWHSVVIISLDKNDYYEYYKSDNKRYLLCVIKNSDYNFC